MGRLKKLPYILYLINKMLNILKATLYASMYYTLYRYNTVYYASINL